LLCWWDIIPKAFWPIGTSHSRASLTNAPAKITRYTRIKAICAEVKSIFHFKYFFAKLSILVLEIKYTKVKL
jgi:hypothetical protein